MANTVLTVPGRYDQIQKIVAFVTQGAREAGLDEDAIFHVELCCDEACTNIIEHAYGGEDVGMIRVRYELLADAFKMIIQDNGRPFDPDQVPPPSLPTVPANSAADSTLSQPQIGGLGLHFMRKLMDEVQFSFNAGGENTLIMIKKLATGGNS